MLPRISEPHQVERIHFSNASIFRGKISASISSKSLG